MISKKEILKFITSKENVLITVILFLHIFSLICFHDTTISPILAIFLLVIYFYVSDRKDKKTLLYTMICFSIWGVLIESFIIGHTNNCMEYKNTLLGLNIPPWLIFVYPFFILGSMHTYSFFKLIK